MECSDASGKFSSLHEAGLDAGGALKGAAAIAALLTLAGCGGGSYMGSLFGRAPPLGPACRQRPAPGWRASRGRLGPAARSRLPVCGRARRARPPTASMPASPPARTSATSSRMGEIARECRVAGNQLIIKIGVEGRVLLGPAGSPGTFTVPVTIAVRDEPRRWSPTAPTRSPPTSLRARPTRPSRSCRTRSPCRSRAGRQRGLSGVRGLRRRVERGRPAGAPRAAERLARARSRAFTPVDAASRGLTSQAPHLGSVRQSKTQCGRVRRAYAPAPKAQPPRKRSGKRTAGG